MALEAEPKFRKEVSRDLGSGLGDTRLRSALVGRGFRAVFGT